MLIERGADIAAHHHGQTPLHLAAKQRQLEVGCIQYLSNAARIWIPGPALGSLRHGDAKGISNNTPLNHAPQLGDAEAVRMLIERGVDVTVQYQKRGDTIISGVAYNNGHWQVEVARVLNNRGVNVRAQDQGGSTPLDFASQNGHRQAEFVCVLIEHGVGVTAQNKGGSTPLHLVSSHCRPNHLDPDSDVQKSLAYFSNTAQMGQLRIRMGVVHLIWYREMRGSRRLHRSFSSV
jgi:tankyrase